MKSQLPQHRFSEGVVVFIERLQYSILHECAEPSTTDSHAVYGEVKLKSSSRDELQVSYG